MGAPHNRDRYGETWSQYRIDVCLIEIDAIRDIVTLSGGWAWHFLSAIGHKELKHGHDHKDIDIFVNPENVAEVVQRLKDRNFQRAWTRYDRLPSPESFRRYEKTVNYDAHEIEDPVKVVIDFFVRDVPSMVLNGYRVVEPRTLLTFYKNIHSSDKCFAVQAASKILSDLSVSPMDIIGDPRLTEIPKDK